MLQRDTRATPSAGQRSSASSNIQAFWGELSTFTYSPMFDIAHDICERVRSLLDLDSEPSTAFMTEYRQLALACENRVAWFTDAGTEAMRVGKTFRTYEEREKDWVFQPLMSGREEGYTARCLFGICEGANIIAKYPTNFTSDEHRVDAVRYCRIYKHDNIHQSGLILLVQGFPSDAAPDRSQPLDRRWQYAPALVSGSADLAVRPHTLDDGAVQVSSPTTMAQETKLHLTPRDIVIFIWVLSVADITVSVDEQGKPKAQFQPHKSGPIDEATLRSHVNKAMRLIMVQVSKACGSL